MLEPERSDVYVSALLQLQLVGPMLDIAPGTLPNHPL